MPILYRPSLRVSGLDPSYALIEQVSTHMVLRPGVVVEQVMVLCSVSYTLHNQEVFEPPPVQQRNPPMLVEYGLSHPQVQIA